jgi:UDP-N-acetylglucosamine--dolichyl-phosphate N-acetylglucosaminephosphotransferase
MDYFIAAVPLIPSIVCALSLKDGPLLTQLLYSFAVALIAFFTTVSLIPVFSQYTLKRGLCGKDLGKKGTIHESRDVPEALGLVCGISFLVCTIISQLLFARDDKQLVIYNSALFSICFMIFLGFMDDTLDLKWRYKLILPTIASLPLLMTYSGQTAMYVPKALAPIFMHGDKLTALGTIVDMFAVVDKKAFGTVIELGYWFKVFMGLQAVFCTNAINIMAGINGLECGQSFVIASSILFFKLYEIWRQGGVAGENELFAIVLILPFIGTSLGLLHFNWYPSTVFVGDTFCYFAGMTFAVVGIHSHFSKTLLLLFIPQIINFLYSVPQLFKLVPCPRHRLPLFIPESNVQTYSRFPCKSSEYRWLKVRPNDEYCPNMTLLCAILRITGPLHEKTLCIVTLALQILCSGVAFYVRYILLEN